MTRKKAKRSLQEIKELIGEEEDILRPLINAVLQEVLEAEMSEPLRAEKSERAESRLSQRLLRAESDHTGRKIELRLPQDRQGTFRPNFLNATNAAKRDSKNAERRTPHPATGERRRTVVSVSAQLTGPNGRKLNGRLVLIQNHIRQGIPAHII